MGKFIIFKRISGEYQFVLKTDNGQTILANSGYETKAECQLGIKLVRESSTAISGFESHISRSGKHYFVLKDDYGHVAGESSFYDCEEDLGNGIGLIQEHAPTANVVDQSARSLLNSQFHMKQK